MRAKGLSFRRKNVTPARSKAGPESSLTADPGPRLSPGDEQCPTTHCGKAGIQHLWIGVTQGVDS